MDKAQVKALVLAHVDLKGLAVDGILEGLVFAKIDQLVADSASKLDDKMAEMLKPLIKDYVSSKIDEALA